MSGHRRMRDQDEDDIMHHHHHMDIQQEAQTEKQGTILGLSRKMWLLVVAACILVLLLSIGFVIMVLRLNASLEDGEDAEDLLYCAKSHPLTPYRLPVGVVKPLHYHLQLRPDLQHLNYSGTVKMEVQVMNHTKCIVFNAEDLQFELDSVQVMRKNGENQQLISVPVVSMEKNAQYRTVLLKLNQVLKANDVLEIHVNDFKAPLRPNEMRGFYQRSYVDAIKGEKHYVAATQFESEDARYAYPCFDEPELKAKFSVSYVLNARDAAKPKMKALTNMPEASRKTLADGSLLIQFETSPVMSTYFTAFVVGEFDYVERMLNNLKIRIYLYVGQEETGRFQLDIAHDITKYLNEYFAIDFPLPKMDLVAVPDFRGAMENMGLLVFNPEILIVDNKTSMIKAADNAEVVAHEIAHQWTGDIITCRWWSDIWLNEGFATFFETHSLNAIRPQFNRWITKLTNSFQHAFVTDALPTSHALINDANSPDEIYAVFDKITYEKGGALLYMIYNAIGAEKFKTWMRAYFNKYQYSNADTHQLFEVMKSTGVLNIDMNLVSAWTYKPGFPIVQVTEPRSGVIRLSQSRFLSRQPAKNETLESYLWWIPITVKSNTGTIQRYDMTSGTLEIPVSSSPNDWFKLNNDQTAFYRVNYPLRMWELLFEQVDNNHNQLSTSDRFGLVDDLFALGFAGHLKLADALRLIFAIEDESANVVWSAVFGYLNKLDSLISRDAIYGGFKRMVLKLIENKYEELGWDKRPTDTEEDQLLRISILSAATKYGMTDAIDTALARYRALQNGSITCDDSGVRTVLYRTFVSQSGEVGYYEMLHKYTRAVDQSDASEIPITLYALAYATEPPLLKTTLEFSLNKYVQTSQETIYLIREVGNNPVGNALAWDFVRDSYEALTTKVNKRVVAYYGLIPGLSSGFSTKTKYDEVNAFFERTKGDSSFKVVHETLENILVNEHLMKTNYVELKAYLERDFPPVL